MTRATVRPAAPNYPSVGNIHSAIQPAEALVFLSSLLTVTHDANQHAIYDLVAKESHLVELKLQAWSQALNDVAMPDYGQWRLRDRKQRALRDIQDLDSIIRLLRCRKTPSGIMRFFWLIHSLWNDLLLLSSLPGAAHVLTDSQRKAGPSAEYREYGSSVIEEANWLIDSLYCRLIRALEETSPKLAATTGVAGIDQRRTAARASTYAQSR